MGRFGAGSALSTGLSRVAIFTSLIAIFLRRKSYHRIELKIVHNQDN